MGLRFKNVPKEMAEAIDTGIFLISYTHVTTDISRPGIEKTGKLMAPSIALAHDIVPFTGEFLWHTYLLRHYHISVSSYPPGEHRWSHYAHGPAIWTPEGSNEWIAELKKKRQEIQEKEEGLYDFLYPDNRVEPVLAIGECIRMERKRQEVYEQLDEAGRESLRNQKHEIYVFDDKLGRLLQRRTAYNDARAEHPFAPGEVKFERYLAGMFTKGDVPSTREWISTIVGREVPVASIDALATWERVFPELPVVKEFPNLRSFYGKFKRDEALRERTREEALAYCQEH